MSAQPKQALPGYVFVVNGNEEDFESRYDGQDYLFPAGDSTAVPFEAARHIFGYGLDDKTAVFVRQGWANDDPGAGREPGARTAEQKRQWFKRFSFRQAVISAGNDRPVLSVPAKT